MTILKAPVLVAWFAVASIACDDQPLEAAADADPQGPGLFDASATDASPPQPAIVRQVFVNERSNGLSLAYGDHPDIPSDDDRTVTEAHTIDLAEILVIFSDRVSGLSDDRDTDGVPPLGAVSLTCDGASIMLFGVGLRYTASGSQALDPAVGPRSLGPQLRIRFPAMPMGSTCNISFGDNVVGPDGTRVCAPPDGDPATPCTPGDTSAISFRAAPLRFDGSVPEDGGFAEVNSAIVVAFNFEIEESTLATITLEDDAGPVEVDVRPSFAGSAQILPSEFLKPNTPHVVTIPAGADGPQSIVGGGLLEPVSFTFTTLPE